jgi:hypothetical protein
MSSAESDRELVFSRIYIDAGWQRHLPGTAIGVMHALVAGGTVTGREIGEYLDTLRPDAPGGLAAAAWEPLRPWTDAELAELAEACPGGAHGGGRRTAAEANEEDERERAEQVALLQTHATALGLPPVQTMGDLLEFMVACTLLTCTEDGPVRRYAFNPHAVLPGEVLPLSESKQAEEDALRWRFLHEPTAHAIIELFHPDSDYRPDAKQTSLRQLARELDIDIETARAGLATLLMDGEFTASHDPERTAEDECIEITVDWVKYHQTRLS